MTSRLCVSACKMETDPRVIPSLWRFASLPDGCPRLEFVVTGDGGLQPRRRDWPATRMHGPSFSLAFEADYQEPPNSRVSRFWLDPRFPKRLDGCFRLVSPSATLAADFEFQPIGAVVLFLLVEHLRLAPTFPARLPPCSTQERLRFMRRARALFNATLQTMHTMNAVLRDDRRRPELKEWFRKTARQHITRAAKLITHCLVMLQTPMSCEFGEETACLGENCGRHPVRARAVAGKDLQLYALGRVHNLGPEKPRGFVHEVAILPPTRHTDPAMLCDLHQYVFRTLMYQVMTPDWHERKFDDDARRIGAST